MRIAVSGYYGFGNAGDEAVLAGMVRAFERAGLASSAFTVLSADPAATQRDHGVRAVPRMDMAQVRNAMRESDALLSGGGSLFQDATSLRSVVYYALIIRMAYRLRRPAIVYAQGIGPLRRKTSRLLVRWAIQPAHFVSVRDVASAKRLREIGVKRADIHVTSDPAFALDVPSLEEGRAVLREAGADVSRPLIGIAPRPWGNADVPALVRGIAERVRKSGYGVVFMPMQAAQDGPICMRALQSDTVALHSEISGTYRSHLAVSSALHAIIALRLHALIFGALGGTSLVGVAYDPKVFALMETLGQSDYVTGLNDATVENVADAVERALSDTDARERLARRVEGLRLEAFANAERVLRSLEGGS